MRLTKHHGLGNDFLVLVDGDGRQPVDAGLARALCDRHRGIGADGFIRVTPADPTTGADVVMELRNADGGRAEMSGNGIRCLAQAVLDAGLAAGPGLRVATDAGVRSLVVRPSEQPGVVWVEVDMGPATVRDEARLVPGGDGGASDGGSGSGSPADGGSDGMVRTARVDLGNPHVVVLVADPAQVDLGRLGPALAAAEQGGANVEVVAVGPGGDELTMRVWERGVGETLACGTGACAAAAAAHHWRLVGPAVTVHQPGGASHVDLRGGAAVLAGPSQRVAAIEL